MVHFYLTIYSQGCDSESTFAGVIINGYGAVRLFNNSLIEAAIPISGSGLQGNSSVIRVFGRDFTLKGLQATSIATQGHVLILAERATFFGSLIFTNNSPYLTQNNGIGMALKNCFIKAAPFNNIATPALDLYSATVAMNTTEIIGFGTTLKSKGGLVHMNKCLVDPGMSPRIGIDIIDPTSVKINNSHIINTHVNITNARHYELQNNKFDRCEYNFLCGNSSVVLNTNSTESHAFEKNIMKVAEYGIASMGTQSGVKFLCNKFETTIEKNFDWEEVNTLQGNGQSEAAGNQFSQTINQIGGTSSPSVVYNYLYVGNEVLNNYSNSGIIALPVNNPAVCGLIGPDWEVPLLPNEDDDEIIHEPCPQGIDCTESCPTGIDCTQHCPRGINCLDACPPGIDCTEPCPPGINCFEPCPPGIDCTEPCPPGVDCTEPCPPGVDCTEPCLTVNCEPPCIGGGCDPVLPEDDDVLEFLNLRFQNLESQQSELIGGSSVEKNLELVDMLNNQTFENKETLLNIIHSDTISITSKELMKIFSHSTIYTEDEVVKIITHHPITLFGSKINRIVFNSKSFSIKNKENLKNLFIEFSPSSQVLSLWQIDSLETQKSKVIQYALYRLKAFGTSRVPYENIWLSRMNDFSSELTIIDNLLSLQDITGVNNAFSNLITNGNLSQDELSDLNSYQTLINLLITVGNSGNNLSSLSQVQIDAVEVIASTGGRYSSSMAQGILETFYDIVITQNVESDSNIMVLEFLENTTTGLQDDNVGNNIKIFPNPTFGDFFISNKTTSNVELQIFDSIGRLSHTENISKMTNREVKANLSEGIFILILKDQNGKIVKNEKIIISK